MSRKNLSRTFLAVALIALTVGFAGCFGTKFTLIDPAKARVDRVYIGDWDALNAKGESADLVIRNIDDKLFYIETRASGAAAQNTKKADRYVGFTVDVNGATFAHVRPMQENGDIPDTWLLMRLDLSDNNRKLMIRQLNEEFFKSKPVETADQLRQVLTKNMNDETMYDKDEQITATRVGDTPNAVAQ